VAVGEGDILSMALFKPFFYTSTDNPKLLALLLTNNIEFTLLYRVSLNSLPDYIYYKETICCTSVRRVSAVDNFPIRWCTSTLGFTCSSVFGCKISKQVDWERWSDNLATTIAG